MTALRDINPADLGGALPLLPDVLKKRVEHVVRENSRVTEAVAALRKGDLPALGKLLNASHASLKDLYEVSCEELDFLVKTAQETPGVLGARMMGGGFGGCAIILAAPSAIESVKHDLAKVYSHRYGTLQPIEAVEPADGATELTLS
jgi:galactokinase